MRRYLMVPMLLATVACGSSRLTRSEAEKDIRQNYPVIVPLKIPKMASAIKGFPEYAKLVVLSEQLQSKGWFKVTRQPAGDGEQFTFAIQTSAPSEVHTAAKGYQIPAAEAEFVKATRLELTRDGAKVTYEIRLVRPTANFGIFQAVYPDARIGKTKTRTAIYRKEGRKWVLMETDEKFKQTEK
jgi:hypothetical protein